MDELAKMFPAIRFEQRGAEGRIEGERNHLLVTGWPGSPVCGARVREICVSAATPAEAHERLRRHVTGLADVLGGSVLWEDKWKESVRYAYRQLDREPPEEPLSPDAMVDLLVREIRWLQDALWDAEELARTLDQRLGRHAPIARETP